MDFMSMLMGLTQEEPKKEETKKAEPKKEAAKAEKKDAKKSEKKESAKPKSQKKEAGFKLPGQVGVVGRNINCVIEAKDSKELIEKLISEGYEMFKISGLRIGYYENLNTVFVDDTAIVNDDPETEVKLPVTVVDGQFKCVIEPENPVAESNEAADIVEEESDAEEDENAEDDDDKVEKKTLKEIIEKWVEVNPSYEGCRMYYDAANNLCYPIGPAYNGLVEEGSRVLAEGEWKVTEESGKQDDVAKKLGGASLRAFEKGYYLCYSAGSVSYRIGGSVAPAKAKKKAEPKYKLPINVHSSLFGVSCELTPENFNGKEEVKVSQIKEVLRETPGFAAIFSDTKGRTVDWKYEPLLNTLSVDLFSGRLGYRLPDEDDDDEEAGVQDFDKLGDKIYPGKCFLVNGESELNKVLTFNNFYGHYHDEFKGEKLNGEVFKTPLGLFLPQYIEGSRRFGSLKFVKTSPKIPLNFLREIIEYFREDLSIEMACRVYFNKKTKEFRVVKSSLDSTSKVHIDYSYKDMEIMKDEWIMLLDVHSHNTMEAFFSSTDDNDHLYPGNFMVLGRLNKEKPTYSIRAGYEGVFCKLPLEEVFAC